MTEIQKIRNSFPQLKRKVQNQKWTYLDSAATTLKPQSVIDRLTSFYSNEVSNVHRGAHFVSDQATTSYENARKTLAQFVNASSENEIVFTSGTTAAINLVATCFCEKYIKPGDEIILSEMEHHSNLVPWQKAAQKHQATLKYIPMNKNCELDFEAFKKLLSKRTKFVSLVYISNALGTTNPIKKFFTEAKKYDGVHTLVDVAQAAALLPIDVSDLNCDFLCFSSHKLFGPFGVGVLWGKEDLLNSLSPYQYGGGMIDHVEKTSTSFLNSPFRFEAGTPNIAGVIGLEAAVQFFTRHDQKEIQDHEQALTQKLINGLKKYNAVKILSHKDSVNIVSIAIRGIHPSDLGQILNQQGVAVRTGHHCAQLIMQKVQESGTLRASFSIYNNEEDVDHFLTAFQKAINLLV